jgi:hypothetical protein
MKTSSKRPGRLATVVSGQGEGRARTTQECSLETRLVEDTYK